jgi:putative membrane protein
MMGDWDGGMGVAVWLLMTVFWVVLLAAIVWAVANLFPARREGSTALPERPEDVLDRRLAQGEIDSATYDELRGKLRAARAERV